MSGRFVEAIVITSPLPSNPSKQTRSWSIQPTGNINQNAHERLLIGSNWKVQKCHG